MVQVLGAVAVGGSILGSLFGSSAKEKAARAEAERAREYSRITDYYGDISIGLAYQKYETDITFAQKSATLAQQSFAAANNALNMKKVADAASITAKKRALYAESLMDKTQIQELKIAQDVMTQHAKADALMRQEEFNRNMSLMLVAGAASGRVMNQGSTMAMFNKAQEDYNWSKIYNDNMLTQDIASFVRDRINVIKGINYKIDLGLEALSVEELANQASYAADYAKLQSAFNDAILGSQYAQINAGIAFQSSYYSVEKAKEQAAIDARYGTASASAASTAATGSLFSSIGSLAGAFI